MNEDEPFGPIGPPEEVSNVEEKKRRFSVGKKGTIIAILIAIFSFLTAGGVLAYKYVWLAPERVFGRAYQKMQDVKTYAYTMNLSLTYKSGEKLTDLASLLMPNVYTLTMDGEADLTDPGNIKQSGHIAIKAPLELASFDLRTIGEIVYVKIVKIPDLGIFGDQLDSYVNQWIEIDYQKLMDQFYAGESAEDLNAKVEEASTKWLELFKNYAPVKITRELDSVELHGQSMFRYEFEVDKEEIKKMVLDVQKLWGTEDLGPNAMEKIDSTLNEIEFTKGELYIGKRDNYIHKMKMGMSLNIENDTGYGLDFDMEFKDHNKEFNISKPLDYKSLDELMGVYINPGSQFASARDAQREADLLSIANAVYQYAAENNGKVPGNMPSELTCIGTNPECYDLGKQIVPTYLPSMPFDPATGSNGDTKYYIFLDENGRVEASSSSELTGEAITVER